MFSGLQAEHPNASESFEPFVRELIRPVALLRDKSHGGPYAILRLSDASVNLVSYFSLVALVPVPRASGLCALEYVGASIVAATV